MDLEINTLKEAVVKLFGKVGNQGFSLVELMTVVGIIGVLSALAVPRLQIFMAKAKQSEAKTSLSALYSLQEAYYGDAGAYSASTAAVGWVAPAGARYTLTTTVANLGTATSGTAGATSICKGQAGADVWTMDANKTLTNTSVLATICP